MNPLEIDTLSLYINDYSKVISADKISLLNQMFALHEDRTTEQIVTVIIPHRQGNELIDIGMKIFEENGIGQKHLNNGILLIIATEEKKIRIITGKGMEISYSEMRCRDIIENHLRPLLDRGDIDELIETWYKIISDKNITDKNVEMTHKIENIIATIGKGDDSPRVSILTVILLLPLMLAGVFVLFTQGMVGLYLFLPILLYIIIRAKTGENINTKTLSRVYIGVFITIIFLSILGAVGYFYAKNGYYESSGSPTYGSDRYDRDDYSSDYSSDSSFDGGGGSSNGGGYGD